MSIVKTMALETSAENPAPLRQVSNLIGNWIGQLGPIWVEGQIAQMTLRQGVCFLTLRDNDAEISVSLNVHRSVLDSSPSPITEGARVVVHAKPDYYIKTGRFSLNGREIRPVGEGELLARLERLKQKLAAEGLFDPRLKKPIPFLPRRIGLITGKGSAAEKDVVENARLRWPEVQFEIRYSLVQGDGAVRGVMTALAELDAHEDVDVIIIARGGGALEDLLPFSDETLVRAVAAARTPIISAIGHEIDTPIMDLAADLRASTPTDAAKRVVPDVAEQRLAIADQLNRMDRALRTRVDSATLDIANLVGRRMTTMTFILDNASRDIAGHLSHLRALSPLTTLERGYAVVLTESGQTVRSTTEIAAGQKLMLRLKDGHTKVTADEGEQDG